MLALLGETFHQKPTRGSFSGPHGTRVKRFCRVVQLGYASPNGWTLVHYVSTSVKLVVKVNRLVDSELKLSFLWDGDYKLDTTETEKGGNRKIEKER